MLGTVFTLARLKIVPTINNFVDVFRMIVRCDVVENYMFLEIHNWCMWLDCDMGK